MFYPERLYKKRVKIVMRDEKKFGAGNAKVFYPEAMTLIGPTNWSIAHPTPVSICRDLTLGLRRN